MGYIGTAAVEGAVKRKARPLRKQVPGNHCCSYCVTPGRTEQPLGSTFCFFFFFQNCREAFLKVHFKEKHEILAAAR